MRLQEWRMFGVGVATMFGVCVWHIAPSAARDEPSPRVKIHGGPAKKGRKPAVSADAAYEASKRAFEALPLSDRKIVQESLVWVAGYKGTPDGTFGKRTRDSLIAFEKSDKGLNQDAVIDKGEFMRLTDAAGKAKDGVGFKTIADKASGMSLGLPLKLLTKRTAVPGGARYASPDNGFVVETRAMAEPEGGLEALYAKLGADKGDRRVTYKIAKAAWFVVSGETGKDGEKHFYSRFERRPDAEASEIRGYTVFYDGARTQTFDRYAIAIANSVEPFPKGDAVAALDDPGGGGGKVPDASPPPAVAQPPRAQLTATAVVVAPGKAVSVLPEACTSPSSKGQPLKIATRDDAASGLVVLEVAADRPVPSVTQDPALAEGDSLVVVGYAAAGDAPVLGVASGDVIVRGASGDNKREARIFAPLQDNAAGSAVFDRSGRFRGVIGRLSSQPRLVAGVVPQASHPLLVGEMLKRALPDTGASSGAAGGDGKRTAGEIAAAVAGSLLPVDCVR